MIVLHCVLIFLVVGVVRGVVRGASTYQQDHQHRTETFSTSIRQRDTCKTNVLCPNHLETYMKTRSHDVQDEQGHRDDRDDHQ